MGVLSFSVGSLVLVLVLVRNSHCKSRSYKRIAGDIYGNWNLWNGKIIQRNQIRTETEKKQASSDTQELSVNYYLVSGKSEVSLYHHYLMQALILHTRYIAFAIVFSWCGTRFYFFNPFNHSTHPCWCTPHIS